MPILNIDVTRFDDLVIGWFRECTPKLLVVTDNLNYSSTSDFGLTEFVNTLRGSTIHGMTPIVTTARFSPTGALSYDATAQHITNFKFTDPTHGVTKSRYDVVLLLSVNRESGPKLTDESGALDAVIKFMQAGGGVFATGDHEDLGAGMCMDIPRVRAMRHWRATDTPSASGTDRLTTNLPGSDDVYQFEDQSDAFPQRLYVNYRTDAGGVGSAHPLLQVPGSSPSRAIEVFPDHPHEGECVVPSNLTTKLPDNVTDEWPTQVGGGGGRVSPEAVALTMSHGNAIPSHSKVAVVPRSFIAICAYNGQLANVGRVVTDATWHHFVNVNLVGDLPVPPPGRQGLTGRNLDDVKQYYKNIVTWLMPKNVRRCRRFPWLLQELVWFPLFEELKPMPFEQLDSVSLREIGSLVATALAKRNPQFQVKQLLDDMLEEALGPDAALKLGEFGREFGKVSAHDAGLAALGALTMATANTATELQNQEKIEGEKVFGRMAEKAVSLGVKRYLEESRAELQKMDALIESIGR
jgi:hypothetical protein